jgi:hypothetical protein
MLRINLSDAEPGMVLALPVRHPAALHLPLLKSGHELDTESIGSMTKLGVDELWVAHAALDCLDQVISQDTAEAHKLFAEAINDKDLDVQVGTDAISRLISALIVESRSAIFIGALAGNRCGDQVRHGTVVTYLSLLLALKLGGYLVRERRHFDPQRAGEVINLGVGAMLHDIGISGLPEAVHQEYEQDGHGPVSGLAPASGARLQNGPRPRRAQRCDDRAEPSPTHGWLRLCRS